MASISRDLMYCECDRLTAHVSITAFTENFTEILKELTPLPFFSSKNKVLFGVQLCPICLDLNILSHWTDAVKPNMFTFLRLFTCFAYQ